MSSSGSRFEAVRRRSHGDAIARSSDAGDTLVEVLITLIVVSLCGLALLTAFTTTISGSAQHRSLAANDIVLRTVAESAFSQIQQEGQNPPYSYAPCATSYPSATPNWSAASGFTASITSIQYWSSGAWAPSPPSDCSTSYPPQLITMQVQNFNGTTDSTTFVVDGRESSVASSGALSVTNVNPSSLGQGALLQNLVITGTGFATSGSTLPTVTFSGNSITVNSVHFTNGTSLAVNVSVPASATPGLYAVTVTNPDGTSVTSTNLFTVDPAPTVSSSSPTSLDQGVQNKTVTVTGSNFDLGAIATFSNAGVTATLTTFVSATELQVNVDVSPTATVGSGTITVVNQDGSSGTSGSIFSVTPGVTITSPTSTSPCVVAAGQTGTCVVTGTGFDAGTTASISANGKVTGVSVVSSTEVDLSVTATGTSGSTGAITVTNSNLASATVTGGFKNG